MGFAFWHIPLRKLKFNTSAEKKNNSAFGECPTCGVCTFFLIEYSHLPCCVWLIWWALFVLLKIIDVRQIVQLLGRSFFFFEWITNGLKEKLCMWVQPMFYSWFLSCKQKSLSARTVRCVDRQDTALKHRDLAAILCFRGPEEGVASVP